MTIYLIFVLFGIILYLLFNRKDRFSVGVPEWWDRIRTTCASMLYRVDGDYQILMDSYTNCNPSITDDILSQLRCAYAADENLFGGCDPKYQRCHMSLGIFQNDWLEQIYNVDKYITQGEIDTNLDNIWFELGEYLNSGEHYLTAVNTSIHSFLLEFKNRQFRILSSWEQVHGFFDFPSMSRWGNFNGHPDWNEFTRLMTILNGGPLLNPDGTKIPTLPNDDDTLPWPRQELNDSLAISEELFSIDITKSVIQTYPKGRVIESIFVFLKINGLK